MAEAAVSDALNALSARFSGLLLQALDAGYEDARLVHNGLIDKRPFLIARCRNAADVVDAVGLAREHGLRSRCAAAATTSPGARPSTPDC